MLQQKRQTLDLADLAVFLHFTPVSVYGEGEGEVDNKSNHKIAFNYLWTSLQDTALIYRTCSLDE